MPLINCEINLDLNCSKNWNILANNENQVSIYLIVDTKLYVQVAPLSTEGNTKLLEQLKPDFKGTIKRNKY